jgi:hypothetical protein
MNKHLKKAENAAILKGQSLAGDLKAKEIWNILGT